MKDQTFSAEALAASARRGDVAGVPRFPYSTAAIVPTVAGAGSVVVSTVYLAGPMTGYPEFNYPAFSEAARVLREWGFDVLSPAEIDHGAGHDPNVDGPQSHSAYMSRDLPEVCVSDAVVVLDGWQASKGARIESAVAAALGKPVVAFGTLAAVEAPSIELPAEAEAEIDYRVAERVGMVFDCDPGDCNGYRSLDMPHDEDVFVGGETKATNPKDAIGSDKLPLHLWPQTATVYGCLGLLDGALKYGRSNWREAGVRATIYLDALDRHVKAWGEGEDFDPDSGLPHLAHALACLAILVDAGAAGKLTDDRQYRGDGYRATVEALTPHVARLKAKHDGRAPKHYTIADGLTA